MPVTRKRRTREHIIADLSVNHVERQVLLCGHTVERIHSNYGYDLLLTTFDAGGEPENGELYLQLKATDTLPRLKNGQAIPWRLQRSDLAHWLSATDPVTLIIYDAQADIAYWLYVQRYFGALPNFNLFAAGKTITVHIPTSNILDQTAIRGYAQFRDALYRQVQGVINHNAGN